MNKPLNLCITILLLFITEITCAQNSRYIEITVSDTIGVKANRITYQIVFGDKENAYLYMDTETDDQKKEENLMEKARIKDVIAMLEKEEFSYKVPQENTYNITKFPVSESIEVTLKNEKELKKLYDLIKKMDGISGKISNVEYEPVSNYTQVIYKNVYEKAKKTASQMAYISFNSLGGLISVTDVQSKDFGYMDIYSKALKTAMFNIGEEFVPRKIEEVTMIFRFEIK